MTFSVLNRFKPSISSFPRNFVYNVALTKGRLVSGLNIAYALHCLVKHNMLHCDENKA